VAARSGPSQRAATLASTLIDAKLGMTAARSVIDTGFAIGPDHRSRRLSMLISAPPDVTATKSRPAM
jgi:hypothetical protein